MGQRIRLVYEISKDAGVLSLMIILILVSSIPNMKHTKY